MRMIPKWCIEPSKGADATTPTRHSTFKSAAERKDKPKKNYLEQNKVEQVKHAATMIQRFRRASLIRKSDAVQQEAANQGGNDDNHDEARRGSLVRYGRTIWKQNKKMKNKMEKLEKEFDV